MRNLSKQEIIDIAVDKFIRVKGRESCNEDVKSTISEIVEINGRFNKSE